MMAGHWVVLVTILLCAGLCIADDFSIVGQRLYESFMPPVAGLNSLYEVAKDYNSNLEPSGIWPDISIYFNYIN